MNRSQERRAIQRRDQISHIFTGEDPSSVKESKKRYIKTESSNVIFNDSYVEKNPNIKESKKKDI